METEQAGEMQPNPCGKQGPISPDSRPMTMGLSCVHWSDLKIASDQSSEIDRQSRRGEIHGVSNLHDPR